MSLISTVFSGLLASVKSEEEQVLLPELSAMFNNVALNPTLPNFLAQGMLFLNEAIAAQTKIGQDVLKSLAADLAVAASQVNQNSTAPPAVASGAQQPAVSGTAAFLAARAGK
jgi:hypothetical protein